MGLDLRVSLEVFPQKCGGLLVCPLSSKMEGSCLLWVTRVWGGTFGNMDTHVSEATRNSLARVADGASLTVLERRAPVGRHPQVSEGA